MTGRKMLCVAVMATAVGCGPSSKPAGTSMPQGSGGGVSGAALAQRYQECWGFFSAHDWKGFQTCYTPDAKSDFVDSGSPPTQGWDSIFAMHTKPIVDAMPDAKGVVELTLINGSQGVTVALFTGHHTGVLKTPMGDIPPTQMMVGQQVAHQVQFAPGGKAVTEQKYYQDIGGMMSQLGLSPAPGRPVASDAWPAEVVIAKNDAAEKRNLENVLASNDVFNKHDAVGLGAYFADDLVWSELPIPTDWDKKGSIESHQALFNAFSDLHITPTTTWAAGDYVVMQGVFAGTNDGPAPEMGLPEPTGKKLSLSFLQLYKLDANGKITRSYGFWNGAAFAMQLGLVPPPPPAQPRG